MYNKGKSWEGTVSPVEGKGSVRCFLLLIYNLLFFNTILDKIKGNRCSAVVNSIIFVGRRISYRIRVVYREKKK